MKRAYAVSIVLGASLSAGFVSAWTEGPTRRHLIEAALTTAGSTNALLLLPSPAAASVAADKTMSPDGLAARLAKRDPALLKNNLFNTPPRAQVYPDFCRGCWQVSSDFRGFIFPSRKIPRDTLTSDVNIAGFQKCSIAATADVGRENVQYTWCVDERTGLEDRVANFGNSIDSHLGYKAVAKVIYDVKSNPNRISIDFVDYRTVNAERIEIFCNARESETYYQDGAPIFVCSETVRQVSFGTGSTPGVPRQAISNYGNYWTWKKLDDNSLTGNLLTAAYLDPQDPLYFNEPTLPVAIYSHSLKATRI